MDLEERTFFLLDIGRLIQKQQEIIDKGKIAEKSITQLNRIKDNFKPLWVCSDEKLRRKSMIEGNKTTYPINAEESPDPVYRKLAKVIEYAGEHTLPIKNYVNYLMVQIEKRKLSKKLYCRFQKTSIEKLANQLVIEKQI